MVKKALAVFLALLPLLIASSNRIKLPAVVKFPPADQLYDSQTAIRNGDVIRGGLLGKYNQGQLDRFVALVGYGFPAGVRVTQYTDEGQAILFELMSDGSTTYCTVDSTRDGWGHQGRQTVAVESIYTKDGIYYIQTDRGIARIF